MSDFDRQHRPDVLDLIHESVLALDTEGRITEWNAASENLYGFPIESAIGSLIGELFGDEALTSSSDMGPLVQEQQVSRQSMLGGTVHVRVRRHVVRTSSGEVIGSVETGVDVTREVESAAALKRWEARCQRVRQSSPTGIWELDSRVASTMISDLQESGIADLTGWLGANPEYVRELMASVQIYYVCGNTIELFGGGDPAVFQNGITPFWPIESYATFCESVLAGIAGAPNFTCETVLQTIHGRRFDAYFSVAFLSPSSKTFRTLVAITDVSQTKREFMALKKSEALYRDLFMASSVSAFHLDHSRANELYAGMKQAGVTDVCAFARDNPDFLKLVLDSVGIIDVNETGMRLFGGAVREEILGSSVAPYWFPDKLEGFMGVVEAAFNDESSFTCETPMRTLDNREITVIFSFTGSQSLREEGQALLSIVDITERVKAQRELVESESNFAHAARISSLGEFATSIAHEVNQPLAAITIAGESSLRWLNRADPNLGEAVDLIQRMIGDARRASAVVGHIRAMATPQASPHSRLCLNTLVDETMVFIRPELRKRGIREKLELEDNLTEIVGDRVQLQQVLMNLAVNAFQAMEETTKPRILIRTSWTRGQVQLEFADNGPGIPEANRPRLFQNFFTTKKSGVGIGLGICRSIVDAHKGTIAAECSDGGGAVFVLRFPRAPAE